MTFPPPSPKMRLAGQGGVALVDYDVAILGAGPTGLSLANLLGVMGVRTVLIERNETTVQAPRIATS